MGALISLNAVDLVYPVYSMRAQSLRNAVANLSVGGKLLKDGSDVIHVRALSQVNFQLQEGDRLGVIGHNGSGKTTLLKVIAGIYEPTAGRVDVRGKISSMIDVGLGLDPSLSGRENVVVMGRMRGLTTKQIQDRMSEIIAFSELGEFIDLPVKIYSSGMSSRLVFAVATTLEPDILLFDEWLSTGDADFIKKASARMNELVSKSRGMVLATHSEALVKEVCNKLLVLDAGSQVYFGEASGWDFSGKSPFKRA
ncbi:ABC transporter ATP-binding protein [Asticcacaulis sp.]|uniref:ABC transporter ATP-binding protein n=1 Tax=Asticcacaulis sp. TaxID=1872648 RepID=UPI0039188BFD